MTVTRTGIITLAIPVLSAGAVLYWAPWDLLCLVVAAGWLYGLTYEPLKRLTRG